MARKTPAVQDNTLVWRVGDEDQLITVGTSAWFRFLDQNTTFSFAGSQGTFTACKERFQRGGWYWRAYRGHSGKVHHAYLGKAEALNKERLGTVAALLAERCVREDPASRQSTDLCVDSLGSAGGDDVLTRVDSGNHSSSRHLLGSLIVTTKLLLPPVQAGLVTRLSLLDRLSEGLHHKLTLISAPAGFGKTTLLAQWSQSSRYPVAWISLDAADSDPARFWTYFVAALQRLYPDFAEPALMTLLSSGRPPSIDSLHTILINAMAGIPEDFVLVLDDYHNIEHEAIHTAMAFLLDHLPPQAHLIIASRTDPPLPLARLRGRSQSTELRAEDLSFTTEETTAFLSDVMKLDLPRADVDALEKRTEGWIVGLQVAALSLRGSDNMSSFVEAFAGSHRHILDYLMEEVLDRQPETLRRFLLQTSILNRLSAPLCEAITGERHCQAILEKLERANLFTVPLDNERSWYRYHHLFSDFLVACLHQTEPDKVPELHHRACLWHAEHGLVGEAVGHALAIRDFEAAASIIQQHGTAMVRHGELTTLLGWFNALPDGFVRERTSLCLLHAWALAGTERADAAESRLADAERSLYVAKAVGCEADEPPVHVQRLIDEVVAIRSMIAVAKGDLSRIAALLDQTLEHPYLNDPFIRGNIARNLGAAYMEGGDLENASRPIKEAVRITQAAGHIPLAISTLTLLGMAQVVQGKLRLAASTYEQAIRMAGGEDQQQILATAQAHSGLAQLLYERNDLAGATQHVLQGIDLGKQSQKMSAMLTGYGVLARLKYAQGDVDGALDIAEQTDCLLLTTDLKVIAARQAAMRAKLSLMSGDLERAVQWAETSVPPIGDRPNWHRETDYRTLARIRIAQGRPEEAIALLEKLLLGPESTGRVGSVIKILAVLSLAWQAAGNAANALATLERALTLAEPEGYLRTFVDAGAPMAALLAQISDERLRERNATTRGVSLAYLRTLLTAFQPSTLSPPRKTSREAEGQLSADALSARELEVLRLIAAGWSSGEISRRLVISINTAKTHIKRVYDKLDAHNREEAVAKAGILEII